MAMVDPGTPNSLSRGRIVFLTLAAAAVALLILFAAVLPAEYHRDPTGLGRITGIGALWAPEETVVPSASAAPSRPGDAKAPASRSYPAAYRSDVIDIPLKISGDPDHGDELEYKVHLKAGASFIYSWTASGPADPEEFYTEFHGEAVVAGKSIVSYYRKATGLSDNGVLTAPFDGVHGWYFQNQSLRQVTVRLRLSGFYDLIPDGRSGNEAGLHARRIE